jgi:4-carboxymuconolactone decarboxylase
LAAQPGLADRLQQVGECIRIKPSVDHRVNEFAILITAQHWGSQTNGTRIIRLR